MSPSLRRLKLVDRFGTPSLKAYHFDFDPKLMAETRDVYSAVLGPHLASDETRANWFAGGKRFATTLEGGGYQLGLWTFQERPILWASSGDMKTYQVFKRFFDALDIRADLEQLVDCDAGIEVYCGFFVLAEGLEEPAWHVDYHRGANAFTLITPLFTPAQGHGDLLYKDIVFGKWTYQYKLGEAILVGEEVSHTTEPFARTDEPRVLLSLTFGTDKMAHWPILRKTAGDQSDFLVLPCGHVRGTCQCE